MLAPIEDKLPVPGAKRRQVLQQILDADLITVPEDPATLKRGIARDRRQRVSEAE